MYGKIEILEKFYHHYIWKSCIIVEEEEAYQPNLK